MQCPLFKENNMRAFAVVTVTFLMAPMASVPSYAAPLKGPSGNYYEHITSDNGFTFFEGLELASLQSFMGATGHLVTITDQEEQDFASSLSADFGWIAASDSEVEGTWKWVAGPENGTVFWKDGVTLTFSAWYMPTGEPNDSLGGEDYAHIWHIPTATPTHSWNDIAGTRRFGYIVEFEASDIPEPASVVILAVGGLILVHRRVV